MSPLNLEDVEEYLVKQAKTITHATSIPPNRYALVKWLRDRFHELREREKVILQAEKDGKPGG